MSPGERGPLPLSELLAKEGYRRKRMVKSEAHHGLERASQLACFSDEQICSNSEPQHWSDLERNKLYEHSSSKKDRFSDQRMHLSKEKTGSTYKSRNYLLNGETPKRVYRSASLEHWKYKSGDYSKYPANDSFEEENSDTCWKSGSLSSEPLIHHKVDGYIKRKSWICSQDKAIDPRKSNMDIKGKTWICSQDKPESPRKIYDKFRVKSQAKVPKSIRQSLLAEKNIDKDLEFINGGNSLHENTRHDVRNSVLTNNRLNLKDISDRGKHLKSEKSFPGSSHELESVERRPLVDQDALQAVVLVISGYISQFMRDKSFRKTLGLHCHSCIGFDHQSKYGDDDFVVNMKRAIVCVENVADGSTNADELKRTKFQLCAIADLNSDDFKYGFTCGIPNSSFGSMCSSVSWHSCEESKEGQSCCEAHSSSFQ